MSKRRMRHILEQIASDHHTTPQEVRRQMQLALDEAQSCTDPVVQARWRSIPHKGKKVTLEEFLEYASNSLTLS
ncbi:MAG: sporulation initiation factor Spo0A [Oscillospiraceae bacterium]|nr:sporulation initiation factor Spo0A [Oscillospiraceae bacterium]